MTKSIKIQYFALMREQRGLSEEALTTTASTALALFQELKKKHAFTLDQKLLRVAINNNFSPWDKALKDGDQVVFIPPVAGG